MQTKPLLTDCLMRTARYLLLLPLLVSALLWLASCHPAAQKDCHHKTSTSKTIGDAHKTMKDQAGIKEH